MSDLTDPDSPTTAPITDELLQLFLKPSTYLETVNTQHYVIPIYGYFFMALTQGLQGISAETMGPDSFPLVGVTIAMAALLGIPVSALMFGGVLHLLNRALGGRRATPETVSVIGAAFFWPGLLSALCSLANVMLVGLVPTALLVLGWYTAGAWALYTTTAGMRALNGFSWLRAASAWPIFIGVVLAIGWVFILGIRVLRL